MRKAWDIPGRKKNVARARQALAANTKKTKEKKLNEEKPQPEGQKTNPAQNSKVRKKCQTESKLETRRRTDSLVSVWSWPRSKKAHSG